MPLVASITSAVSIPVIAAGGIADGRGLAAAFMLGAEAIQCGTAFLLTEECPISQLYKEKLLQAEVTDTIETGRITRDVVRSLASPLTKAMYAAEFEGNASEIQKMGTGSLRRAVFDGDWERGSFLAGQAVGLIHEYATCKDLVERIMWEALETVQNRASYFL